MLSVLKRRGRRACDGWPALPPGERVYAIGDVHGRIDLLDALVAQIEADEAGRGPARRTLVLLGDLVDRGPDSAAVVARAMALAVDGALVLKGNHEDLFLRAVGGDVRALRALMRNGGIATLESYGIPFAEQQALPSEEAATALLMAHVPAAHVAFLEALPTCATIGDYLFVHAGIRPGVPLADQHAADLMWIREPFLRHDARHDAMVVHGHSISAEPQLRHNRLGIDTGAYASGRLTALGLEGTERWLLAT